MAKGIGGRMERRGFLRALLAIPFGAVAAVLPKSAESASEGQWFIHSFNNLGDNFVMAVHSCEDTKRILERSRDEMVRLKPTNGRRNRRVDR